MYSLVNLKIAYNFKSNTYLLTEKAKNAKERKWKIPTTLPYQTTPFVLWYRLKIQT